jgi:transcriptional regulator with XRE-family HTH domain
LLISGPKTITLLLHSPARQWQALARLLLFWKLLPFCQYIESAICAYFRLSPMLAPVTITNMIIGERIKTLRERKGLSQGDIEKRSALLRCYLSRVENGHTVPSIETLEKLALALEVPLYQLFYDSAEPPQLPNLPERKTADEIAWGGAPEEARFLNRMARLLARLSENDRSMLLHVAQRMVEP